MAQLSEQTQKTAGSQSQAAMHSRQYTAQGASMAQQSEEPQDEQSEQSSPLADSSHQDENPAERQYIRDGMSDTLKKYVEEADHYSGTHGNMHELVEQKGATPGDQFGPGGFHQGEDPDARVSTKKYYPEPEEITLKNKHYEAIPDGYHLQGGMLVNDFGPAMNGGKYYMAPEEELGPFVVDPNTHTVYLRDWNFHVMSHTLRPGRGNLVVGIGHSFNLATNSFIAGEHNTVAGESVTVAGGRENAAEGAATSVLGGEWNIATGNMTVVSSGTKNEADGRMTAITGGEDNEADGDMGVVSGGGDNVVEGGESVVTGGEDNR